MNRNKTILISVTEKKTFKGELKKLIKEFGYEKVDKIIIHLGENCGVRGGEISANDDGVETTKYF